MRFISATPARSSLSTGAASIRSTSRDLVARGWRARPARATSRRPARTSAFESVKCFSTAAAPSAAAATQAAVPSVWSESPTGSAVALPHLEHHVQPHVLGRAGILRRALEDGQRAAGAQDLDSRGRARPTSSCPTRGAPAFRSRPAARAAARSSPRRSRACSGRRRSPPAGRPPRRENGEHTNSIAALLAARPQAAPLLVA